MGSAGALPMLAAAPPLSMNIFISYRRDDSVLSARLIHNELASRFGAEHVFMDLDDIGYGDDFAHSIDAELARCDVVLVVIGPRWAQIIEQRLRGDDWVRHEIASALRMHAQATGERAGRPRVLPVLVAGAAWPGAPLPSDIAGLQALNALRIDERSLKPHLTALIEAVKRTTFEEEAAGLRAQLSGRRRVHLATALLGVMVFLASWIGLFDFFGLDTRLASETMQIAGAGPSVWSGQVLLVAIDEGTERAVGRRFDASWRREHAQLITAAAAAGARTLAFDVVFEGPGPDDVDATLADALDATRATMPVVFGVQRLDDGQPALHRDFAGRASWGIACAGLALGQARSLPLALQRSAPAGDGPAVLWPSLALAAYSGGGAVEAFGPKAVQVRLAPEQRSPSITFFAAQTVDGPQPGCEVIRGGDRVASQLIDPQTVPLFTAAPERVAYEALWRGDPQALALLKGRIALVGVLKTDQDRLPVGGDGQSRWGAELLATQIDGMVRGAAIRPMGAIASWLLHSALAVCGAALALALYRRPRSWRVAAVVMAMIVFAAGAVLWYRWEQQLIGLPYGLAALALGSWTAGRLIRRDTA